VIRGDRIPTPDFETFAEHLFLLGQAYETILQSSKGQKALMLSGIARHLP